jgi:hypothetical protein
MKWLGTSLVLAGLGTVPANRFQLKTLNTYLFSLLPLVVLPQLPPFTLHGVGLSTNDLTIDSFNSFEIYLI